MLPNLGAFRIRRGLVGKEASEPARKLPFRVRISHQYGLSRGNSGETRSCDSGADLSLVRLRTRLGRPVRNRIHGTGIAQAGRWRERHDGQRRAVPGGGRRHEPLRPAGGRLRPCRCPVGASRLFRGSRLQRRVRSESTSRSAGTVRSARTFRLPQPRIPCCNPTSMSSLTGRWNIVGTSPGNSSRPPRTGARIG